MSLTRSRTGNSRNASPIVLSQWALAPLMAALVWVAMIPSPAQAATIVVDSLTDAAPARDGACTLREAIANANGDNQSGSADCAAGTGVDTIRFGLDGIIPLSSSLPAVSDSDLLTIDGTDHNVVLNGDGKVQILVVDEPAALTLIELVLANGVGAGIGGGGVQNKGTLNADRCGFLGNSTGIGTDGGGAIYNEGTLNVSNGDFEDNNGFDGCAIFNKGGKLRVHQSHFIQNTTTVSAGGAAIYNLDTGTLEALVTNSTFVGNNATFGGAISNVFSTLRIVNSTFAGNAATDRGGAIFDAGVSGQVTILQSTFAGNTAFVNGGAIFNGSVPITLRNSIVANSAFVNNCAGGTITDAGGNLRWPDTDPSCAATISFGDPKLGPLADNGGGILTIALLAGSAAIDAANPDACADPNSVNNLDQRGASRPVDGDGNGSAICDTGAVERGAVAPTPIPTGTPSATPDATAPPAPTGTPTPSASAASTAAQSSPTVTPTTSAVATTTSPSVTPSSSTTPPGSPPNTVELASDAGPGRLSLILGLVLIGSVLLRRGPSRTSVALSRKR